MVPPCPSPGDGVKTRLHPFCSRFGPAKSPGTGAWLIIINALGLFDRGGPLPSTVPHAIAVSIHCLHIPARRYGRCFRRQPRLHCCQSGRRLWHRPVPRQRREMRRPCRPLLLPVTGICPGHRLSACRPRRNYRRRSQGQQREMYRQRLRRIRRHYLPALNGPGKPDRGRFATPAPRKRRDAAPRSSYWMPPWPHTRRLGRAFGLGSRAD